MHKVLTSKKDTIISTIILSVFFFVSVIAIVSLLFIVPSKVFSQTNQPFSNIKSVSLVEKSSDAFVLNGNGTITIYDSIKDQYRVTQKKLLSPIRSEGTPDIVFTSPSGNYFVTVTFLVSGMKVNTYESKKFIDSGAISSLLSSKSLSWEGGSVFGKFVNDEETFLITDSASGTVFLLDFLKDRLINRVKFTGIITSITIGKTSENVFFLTQQPNAVVELDINNGKVIKTYALKKSSNRLLFNKTLSRLFVSHQGGDSVSTINLRTGSIQEISVGKLPGSMVYNPQNGTVFVANNGDGTLTTIESDLSVVTQLLSSAAYARSSPITLFYSNVSQKLLVLNISSNILTIFDPEQKTILKEEKIKSGRISGFLGSGDSTFAVISHFDSNTIALVDPTNFSIEYVPNIDAVVNEEQAIFSSPQGISIDTDGGRLFVSNLGTGDISVIDESSLKLIAKIPVGSSPQSLSFNVRTKKLYVTDPVDNTITVIDTTKDNYPKKIIPVNVAPRAINASAENSNVYVSLSGGNRLGVIDPNKDILLTEISLNKGTFPLITSIDENRNKVYVASYGGNVVSVIDGETNRVEKVIIVGEKPIWVRYIPDLDQVYVSVEGEQKVVVISPETYKITDTININAIPYRILLDLNKGLIYIVHRNEPEVTVLGKDGNGAKIIAERNIPFIGLLDTVYNMITGSQNTKRLYLTNLTRNELVVTNSNYGEDNIIMPQLLATINQNGNVTYTSEQNKSAINISESRFSLTRILGSQSYTRLVFVGIAGISLLGFLSIFFVILHLRRSRK